MGGSKPLHPTLRQDILANVSPAICFAGGAGTVLGPRQSEPFAGLRGRASCAGDGQMAKEQPSPFPGRAGRAAAPAAWGPAWWGTLGQELLASDLRTAAALAKF